jgi:peptidoglycan/xylan/chitin deacetylase (PgdA/CDA1 family)
MFHGVAPNDATKPPQMDHWLEPRVFDRYGATLRRDRFETLFLGELRAFRAGSRSVSPRSVALTFDDGYLDFWLHVFPVLRRYELKATVFVTTDFIDGETPARRLGVDAPWGFVSWPEMRAMVASGLVEVQSHAATHTWYPIGPEIVDAHRPDLPWPMLRHLWWNAFPERKPRWYTAARHDDLPWGLPVFRHEKSLLARRYIVRPEVATRLVERVQAAGGASFFSVPEWRTRYQAFYDEVRRELGDTGVLETPQQRRDRVRHELRSSRETLSRELGYEVRFLCCPGGSLDDEVLSIAAEVGYDAVSVPRWFERGLNRPGGNLARFYRVPSTSPFTRWRSAALDAWAFRVRVYSELGASPYRQVWAGLGAARRWKLI